MEQFSLEKYLANPSRKVVTRDGRSVRVICTDAKGDFPTITLVELLDGTAEQVMSFTSKGSYYISSASDNDLFFASEKHEGWVNLYKLANKDCAYYTGSIFNSKAEAENKRDKSDLYVATIKLEWEE